eukprot:2557975-Rhodomonas_salina.2
MAARHVGASRQGHPGLACRRHCNSEHLRSPPPKARSEAHLAVAHPSGPRSAAAADGFSGGGSLEGRCEAAKRWSAAVWRACWSHWMETHARQHLPMPEPKVTGAWCACVQRTLTAETTQSDTCNRDPRMPRAGCRLFRFDHTG